MKKSSIKITGGVFKGRKIFFPNFKSIRPGTSMAREAIFNILGDRVDSSNVLDLFAGSGSVGLEALSRGAAFCLFVDNNKDIVNMIKESITLLKIENRADVFLWDIIRNLNFLKKQNKLFDIAFIDPPYYKDFLEPTLINLKKSDVLKKGAILVMEHSAKDIISKNVFTFFETRKYGKTNLTFFKN